MANELAITNQDSKAVLAKARNPIDITNKILANKSSGNLVKSFAYKPFLMKYGHSNSVSSIAITSDNRYIVSKSSDDAIKIWDMESGECIYIVDHSYAVAIDKNGFFVALDEAIDKYIRVSEAPLSQRKLAAEEINHFREKSFL